MTWQQHLFAFPYAPNLGRHTIKLQAGPGFPRVTAAGLIGDATLAGVGPVEYFVDLDSAPAEASRVDLDVVDEFLGHR